MTSIPKIIHYCWFGYNEKSSVIKKCIESWHHLYPDWQYYEWNEGNYNVHQSPFIEEAYFAKKWAFVSDYARFDVLYRYGGIYIDTDVEILRPIPDEMLMLSAFTGVESAGLVSPGLVFAAIKEHPFVGELLSEYKSSHFIVSGKPNYKTVNQFTTDLLKTKGYCFSGTEPYQDVANVRIFPSEVFCGFDLDIHEPCITDRTITVHHYASSWQRKGIKTWGRELIKHLFGRNIYKKMLTIKRKLYKQDR